MGAGSTAQELAQELWVDEFKLERPDVTVTYDPVGSGRGREQFVAGEAAYAASDAPLEGTQLDEAVDRCRPGQLIEVPVYISAVEVVYNLRNSGLYLSPATVVEIFNGEIAKWDDPAIRRQNPTISTVGLPTNLPIVPVYRSDESGTTQNFTEYLSAAAPDAWKDGPGETWPLSNGEGVKGTRGAIEAIYAREGAVGYVDASQVSTLGKVSVKVGSEYATPSTVAAALAVAESPKAEALSVGPYTFPVEVDRKPKTRGAYPIALVSYLIACTAYESDEEAAAVKGFLQFATGREGQELAAEEVGTAPLLPPMRTQARAAIDAIETGS